MNWIATLRPYLEIISFAATTTLAIGLVLSRQQLSAFRKDIKIRNDRQAKEKAVEAAKYYMIDHIACHSVFFEDCQKIEAEPFQGEPGNFSPKGLSEKELEQGRKRAFETTILPVLNSLEIVAAYFVSGVADEKTGFQIIGKSFCSSVRYNYVAICLLREENAVHNYWFNIVELFQVWDSRIQRMNVTRASEQLQKTLRDLPDTTISAVGSDI